MSINTQHLAQLKAYAQLEGLYLSIYMTAGFLLTMNAPESGLGNILTLCTPFFTAWRLRCFRDDVLEGSISLRRAAAFVIYTFFYASLIFAIVQYVYFRYLDNGTFAVMVNQSAEIMKPYMLANGMTGEEWQQSIDMMTGMTPIYRAFMFMMQNIVAGFVLALPLGVIYRKH